MSKLGPLPTGDRRAQANGTGISSHWQESRCFRVAWFFGWDPDGRRPLVFPGGWETDARSTSPSAPGAPPTRTPIHKALFVLPSLFLVGCIFHCGVGRSACLSRAWCGVCGAHPDDTTANTGRRRGRGRDATATRLSHSGAKGVPGRLVVDSGLDAFSQYPSHDSFATPATRLIAETRGAARGFLSYYHVLPSSHPGIFLFGVSFRWGLSFGVPPETPLTRTTLVRPSPPPHERGGQGRWANRAHSGRTRERPTHSRAPLGRCLGCSRDLSVAGG